MAIPLLRELASVAWAAITGKPTTVSGYGITDAVDTVSPQTVDGIKTLNEYLLVDTNANSAAAGAAGVSVFGDGNKERVEVVASSGDPTFQGLRFGGTVASPSNTLIDSDLVSLAGGGWADGGRVNSAFIRAYSTENWSATGRGVQWQFRTTPVGGTVPVTRVHIDENGLTVDSGELRVGANIVWHAGNDGPGSGLDADQLEGLHGNSGAVASTVAVRDANADIHARLFRASFANQTTVSGALAFRVNNTTDNYTRYCSDVSAIRTFLEVPAGVWTPTLTAIANVASSVSRSCFYQRQDGIVAFSGAIDVTPTAPGVTTTIDLSLPIASNLGTFDVFGAANAVAGADRDVVEISSNATNDRIRMSFVASSTTLARIGFSGMYRIV